MSESNSILKSSVQEQLGDFVGYEPAKDDGGFGYNPEVLYLGGESAVS